MRSEITMPDEPGLRAVLRRLVSVTGDEGERG